MPWPTPAGVARSPSSWTTDAAAARRAAGRRREGPGAMSDDAAATGPGAPPAIGHPRPLLRRRGWVSLDGPWDFVLDDDAHWAHPDDVPWDGAGPIRVPFAPETAA